jgi:hypothetical protein
LSPQHVDIAIDQTTAVRVEATDLAPRQSTDNNKPEADAVDQLLSDQVLL